MSRASMALVASLALALALPAAASEGARAPRAGAVLDLVVAVVRSPASVESVVITRRLLEVETRIALVARGQVLAGTDPLDPPAMQEGLDWLLDQMLANDEAARLRVFEVEPADAAAELDRFEAQFASPAAYAAFLDRCDIGKRQLEAVLGRMLRVRRYVEGRVSHAAQVPESEVTAWLDQHATELGTRDREAARAQLGRVRTEEEARALFRDLRARAEVRLLAPPAELAVAGRSW